MEDYEANKILTNSNILIDSSDHRSPTEILTFLQDKGILNDYVELDEKQQES